MADQSSSTDAPKKGGLPTPLIVILILALGGGGAYFGYGRWKAMQPFEWSGTVEARTIAVGSRTGGRIKEVLVKEGDHVEAGQPLVIIESGDLEAQRLMAEAQLEQSQAALDKLKNGARPEEIAEAKARADTAEASLAEAQHGSRAEEIAGAKARLEAAQAAEDKARLDSSREHQLFSAGAISKAEVDTADTALRSATAQKDAAQATLSELSNGVRREQLTQAQTRAEEAKASAKLVVEGARVEDIRAGEAMVKASKGRLDQIKIAIDELTIHASKPARVETLDLRPGDIIAPSSTAAVLLEDDELYVRIYVPETELARIHPQDNVPVYVDTYPNKAFPGFVAHIDAEGQYSPRNLQTADERANQVFAVRVDLKEGADTLRAGMAASIRVKR